MSPEYDRLPIGKEYCNMNIDNYVHFFDLVSKSKDDDMFFALFIQLLRMFSEESQKRQEMPTVYLQESVEKDLT